MGNDVSTNRTIRDWITTHAIRFDPGDDAAVDDAVDRWVASLGD